MSEEVDPKSGTVILQSGDSVIICLAPGAEPGVSERMLENENAGCYFRLITNVVGVTVKRYDR